MTVLIEARSISMMFRSGHTQTQALRDVDFALTAGESVALMGPSGCGKSTLLAILGLLMTPHSGKVLIEAHPAPLRETERARVRNTRFGYVHQEYAIIDDESVAANVAIPLEYARPRRNRRNRGVVVQHALTDVGLSSFMGRRAGELSGGERQRVAIARALVNRPDIILADEPTAALDQETGTAVISLLLDMRSRGAGLILATHDVRVADRCDRVILMDYGNVVGERAAGQTEQLLSDGGDPTA